jgi:hypothetical protein
MRHDEIVVGCTYVGRGIHRRTRHVLRIGPAAEVGVPPEHIKFLAPKATFVLYRIEDGTETYEALVAFAQWAATIDAGWPREEVDLFMVHVEDEEVSVRVYDRLSAQQAKKLSRWLLDASRDVEGTKESADSRRSEDDL